MGTIQQQTGKIRMSLQYIAGVISREWRWTGEPYE